MRGGRTSAMAYRARMEGIYNEMEALVDSKQLDTLSEKSLSKDEIKMLIQVLIDRYKKGTLYYDIGRYLYRLMKNRSNVNDVVENIIWIDDFEGWSSILSKAIVNDDDALDYLTNCRMWPINLKGKNLENIMIDIGYVRRGEMSDSLEKFIFKAVQVDARCLPSLDSAFYTKEILVEFFKAENLEDLNLPEIDRPELLLEAIEEVFGDKNEKKIGIIKRALSASSNFLSWVPEKYWSAEILKQYFNSEEDMYICPKNKNANPMFVFVSNFRNKSQTTKNVVVDFVEKLIWIGDSNNELRNKLCDFILNKNINLKKFIKSNKELIIKSKTTSLGLMKNYIFNAIKVKFALSVEEIRISNKCRLDDEVSPELQEVMEQQLEEYKNTLDELIKEIQAGLVLSDIKKIRI